MAQQPLTQSASTPHSPAHTGVWPTGPAHAVGMETVPELVSGQQSLSAEHALPRVTEQPAVERHQEPVVHTCAPLVSSTQQPLAQSELTPHCAVQTVPTPSRSAHIAPTWLEAGQ